MKIIAKKIVYEMSEEAIVPMETILEVQPNETVEMLMMRCDITGKSRWHFDQAQVILKLVKLEE